MKHDGVREKWTGRTALWTAVSQDDVACVKLLLEGSANVPDETLGGIVTPSFDFPKVSSPEIPYLLMKHGANVDALGSPGGCWSCALEKATQRGRTDGIVACSWLLDVGATVNLQIPGPYDIPIVAAAVGGREILDLRSRGADVKTHPKSRDYGGILAAAFCGKQPDMLVPHLIEEAGADPGRLMTDLLAKNPRKSGIKA